MELTASTVRTRSNTGQASGCDPRETAKNRADSTVTSRPSGKILERQVTVSIHDLVQITLSKSEARIFRIPISMFLLMHMLVAEALVCGLAWERRYNRAGSPDRGLAEGEDEKKSTTARPACPKAFAHDDEE